MNIICRNCGSSIDSNSSFCDQCGSKLVDDQPVIQAPAETDSPAETSSTVFYQAPSGSEVIPRARSNQKMIIAVSSAVVLLAAIGLYAWNSGHKGPAQPTGQTPSKSVSQNVPAPASKSEQPQTPVPAAQKPSSAAQGTVTKTAAPAANPPAAPSAPTKTVTASKAKTTINQVISQKQVVSRMYLEYTLSVTSNAPNQNQKKAAFNSSVAKLGHMLYSYYVADKRGGKAQARDEMRLFLIKLEGNGSPASNQQIAWGVSTVR